MLSPIKNPVMLSILSTSHDVPDYQPLMGSEGDGFYHLVQINWH